MKVGPYTLFPELPSALAGMFLDAHRIRMYGIPSIPGDTPVEIAKAVLIHNAQDVFNAGQGHFLFMWPTDFGKAIRGALEVLPHSYIGNLIQLMIIDSNARGKVSSCFTFRKKFTGFDMPYERADNLPWLFHSICEYATVSGDKQFIAAHKERLQRLIDAWEKEHIVNGMISVHITGDWMDTVLRPSSTYNNMCAVHLLTIARSFGLTTKLSPERLTENIFRSRLRDGYFTDYDDTERRSIDASVVALYLELFDVPLREKLADVLEKSAEVHPYPIRCATDPYPIRIVSPIVRFFPHYHDGIWLHLGMMYLNGLKKIGKDIAVPLRKIDALTMRHRNMIETLTPEGGLFTSPFHATEYGLTMTAGQYLELCEK